MNDWLKLHARVLKNTSLAAMLIIPFGLYFAVRAGAKGLTWTLLALMGLVMAAALRIG